VSHLGGTSNSAIYIPRKLQLLINLQSAELVASGGNYSRRPATLAVMAHLSNTANFNYPTLLKQNTSHEKAFG